jgi:hypothetical protein
MEEENNVFNKLLEQHLCGEFFQKPQMGTGCSGGEA